MASFDDMPCGPEKAVFVLEALDVERWYPVLVAKFAVARLDDLRAILGEVCAADPGVARCCPLNLLGRPEALTTVR